jgi:hypothetical protein
MPRCLLSTADAGSSCTGTQQSVRRVVGSSGSTLMYPLLTRSLSDCGSCCLSSLYWSIAERRVERSCLRVLSLPARMESPRWQATILRAHMLTIARTQRILPGAKCRSIAGELIVAGMNVDDAGLILVDGHHGVFLHGNPAVGASRGWLFGHRLHVATRDKVFE